MRSRYLAILNMWVGVKRRKGERALFNDGRKPFAGLTAATSLHQSPGASSHSSKLQHRAPLEIVADLSHLRKTLESGVPVLPSSDISRCRWAVAFVLRGSLAYRGSLNRNKHELQTSSFPKLAPVAEFCQGKRAVNCEKICAHSAKTPITEVYHHRRSGRSPREARHLPTPGLFHTPHGSHELAPYRQRATPLCLANTAPRMEICRGRGPGLRTDRSARAPFVAAATPQHRPTQLADSMPFPSNSEPRTAVSPRSSRARPRK